MPRIPKVIEYLNYFMKIENELNTHKSTPFSRSLHEIDPEKSLRIALNAAFHFVNLFIRDYKEFNEQNIKLQSDL